MPLHVLLSTSTDRLIDDLVESLARPGAPEALRPVLLPSRPLVERVRAALARRTGVAMGVQFLLPAAFVSALGQALGQEELHAGWSPEGMFWRIFGLLEEHKNERRLQAACEDELARLSLARQVADRFDQYLHFRPELIAAWDRGEDWGELPEKVREDQRWQRLLWDGLRRDLGDFPHPAKRLELLLEKARVAPPGLLAPAVEVLATGPLPSSQLKVLAALGGNAEVRLRVLMPSSAYFGDIQSAKAQRYLGQDANPDAEGHPLLAQMGAQARAHLRILVDLDESGQHLDDSLEPEWAAPNTLLQAMQSDIRASRPTTPLENFNADEDRSLRVHRCHGPRREMEVLRDELLRAFKDHPDLKPEEVLILAPDLEVYGPLAEAVLAGQGLPLRLAERKGLRNDPMQQAAGALVAFAAGRCTLSEGLGLLDLPALRLVLGDDQADALAERLSRAGITFGLDAEHRRSLGAGGEATGTWRAGLDRLLAGQWLGPAAASIDKAGVPLLPVSGDLGSATDWLEGLAWWEDLLALVARWQTAATPSEWAERMDAALELLFLNRGVDQDLDLAGLDELLAQLRQAGSEFGADMPLQAASLAAWMDEAGLDEIRLVTPVGGAIGLGGLKPLRALPCRVLAMVGLKDSAFPRRSQAPAWDLLAAKKQSGDRDPREEDRQLFLDALLAARDRVILCAPALSPQTNKEEPLSTCVEELLRVAGQDLVLKHPLQPFNPDNFLPAAESFDSFHAALSEALADGRQREDPVFASVQSIPGAPADAAPDLDGLLSFFGDPSKAWLKRLGITPPREAEGAEDDDAEPLNLDGLQRWQLADAVLGSLLKGEEPFLSERLAADRLLPYGLLGRASGAGVLLHLQSLVEKLRAKTGPWQAQVLSAQWGDLALSGTVLLSRDGKSLCFCSASALDKPRVRLEAWVLACLAAAAGEKRELHVGGYDKSTGDQLETLKPVAPEVARASLGVLLKLWQQGQRELLPFAPKTAYALAEVMLDPKNDGPEDADATKLVRRALAKWQDGYLEQGEGSKPSHHLAWRGQDPLEGDSLENWKQCALDVWTPVFTWWAPKKKWGDA